MSDAVIVAIITAGAPVIVTIVTALIQHSASERHAAKSSILQMILEDHIDYSEGRFPTNYQNILHEWDIYEKNKGNSYVHEKVDAYKEWFHKVEGEQHENSN